MGTRTPWGIALLFTSAAVALSSCASAPAAQEILQATNRVARTSQVTHTSFVPYLDATLTDPISPDDAMDESAVSRFLVGPITGASGMCTPMWGASAAQDLVARRQVREVLDAGGTVDLALGGPVTVVVGSMESHCASTSDLAGTLAKLREEYRASDGTLPTLDFVFGVGQSIDPVDNAIRVAAVRLLQDETVDTRDGQARVALTVPAHPGVGLSREGLAALTAFIGGGVDISAINLQVIGSSDEPAIPRASMSELVISTARLAMNDIKREYRRAGERLSPDEVWSRIGLRVTIGENPSSRQIPHGILTVADARRVAGFAREQADAGAPLANLSMTTFNRDHHCLTEGSTLDNASGQLWAPPQSTCNISGGRYSYSMALGQ